MTATAAGLRHEAYVYDTDAGFADATAGFVRAGLAAGEPVFVALRDSRASLLRDALGAASAGVSFHDMAELGANPSRIIPAMAEFLGDAGPRPVRAVGEPVWASRGSRALRECVRHEALINLAFADAPLWWVCPYAHDLDPALLDDAWHTHPLVTDGHGTRSSGRYTDPEVLAPLDEALPPAPADAVSVPVPPDGLAPLRDAVHTYASAVGLAPDRADDLVLAVNEVVTNAVRYGGRDGDGAARLRLWEDDGALVCELAGPGRIRDPLVGRMPPSTVPEGGRGLWLVNQVCDLVELRSGASGTVVRMHVRR